MITRNLSQSKGSALLRSMALAFMLLVMGMNVADAAECAPDTSPSEITEIAASSETSDKIPAPEEQSKHGVCPHGHCHNGSVTAVRAVNYDMSAELTNASFHGEADQFALSAHIARLKRPPRA
jgi:hypothetical protein